MNQNNYPDNMKHGRYRTPSRAELFGGQLRNDDASESAQSDRLTPLLVCAVPPTPGGGTLLVLFSRSPSPYELPPPLLRASTPTTESTTESLPTAMPPTEITPVYPDADDPYSDDDSSSRSDAHEPSPPFSPLPQSIKLKHRLPSRTKSDSAHPDSASANDANSEEDILADVPETVYVPLIQTEWPPVVYAAYPPESSLREAREGRGGSPGESGEIREDAGYDADDEGECLSEEGEEVVYLHPALVAGLGLAAVEEEDEEVGEDGEDGR